LEIAKERAMAETMTADHIDGRFKPLARASVASVELDGEGVLYDEEQGLTHLLNPTATVVWSCLDGERSVDDLGVELAEAFGADVMTVSADVLALVRELARQGLLEGVSADPPRGGVEVRVEMAGGHGPEAL
jgi:hypothetical protein